MPTNATHAVSRRPVWRQPRPTTAPRRPGALRQRLQAVRTEPGWMWALLVAFIVTLFIPKQIALGLGPIQLTPALAVSMLLFPVFVVSGRIRWAWPDLIVLLFYVLTFISFMLTSPMGQSIEAFGRRVLAGAVPYMVGRYVGARPDLLKPFLRWTVAIMAALAIAVLMESLYRLNIHSILWRVAYTPHHELRLGLTRAHGWTSHAIMLGVSYAIFVPIAIVAGLERIRAVGRFPWIKAGLLMIGVFCSLSTGAWLPAAMAVGLIVWDYCSLMRPGPRWLLLSFGSLGMYFCLEVLSGRPLLRILMMDLHLSSATAWYYRWRLYERVYEVMPGHWWFGHGLVTPTAFTNTVQWSIDNNYLVVLMSYGIVGLVWWIGMSVSVVVYGWPSVWRAADSPYVRLARAVMYSIVTVGLTQLSVALFSTAAMLYWLFLGLALGMAQGLMPLANRRAAPKRAAQQRRRPPRTRPIAAAPPRPAVE